MSLFSFYKGPEDFLEGQPSWPVDLGRFRIGPHRLGAEPDRSDPWGRLLGTDALFKPNHCGLEIGTRGGLVDHAFIDVGAFTGGFLVDGEPLAIGPETLEPAILDRFGEPYWTDRTDGEVILFYEYAGGGIELQFEFPDAAALAFITLSRNGVLADEGQRAAYGCDRPWPPA